MRLGTWIGSLAAAAFATSLAAQPAALDETVTLRAADKRQVVSKALDLSPEEAARFWPLYEKFQRELETVQRRQNRAVLDYVAADGKLTDANADRLAREALDAWKDEAAVRRRHYDALKKRVPPAKAARYVQVENKFRAAQQYEIAKAIPLAR